MILRIGYASHAWNTVEECEAGVIECCAFLGYKVTLCRVERLEDFQFLKISPTLTSGGMSLFVNLGVVLRSLGTCDGDLPGSGDLLERGFQRNCDIVAGMVHCGNNPVMNALRRRFPSGDASVVNTHYWLKEMRGFEEEYTSSESLSRRYKVSAGDIDNLCSFIENSNMGDLISCDVLRSIYKIDYDL